MEKKKCASCGEEKDLEEFNKQKLGKFGHRSRCKECQHAEYKTYSSSEEVKRNKKEYARKRRDGNEELRKKELFWAKRYLANNKEAVRERRLKKIKTPEFREKERLKYKTNENYRIKECLSARVRQAMSGRCKSASTMILIGCSIEELKIYLESLWTEGMSWENYGLYGWHIDHIKPCCAFDLLNPEDQYECFHYTNLQPLWAKDNLSKNGRYPIDQTVPSTQTNPDPQEKDEDSE